MRWRAALMLGGLLACGNSSEPRAERTPEPLVIPPLDASASPKVVVTPVPASTTSAPPDRERDEFDDARDPLAKQTHRRRSEIVSEQTLAEKVLPGTPPGLARQATLKRLGDLDFRLSALLPDINDGSDLRKDAIRYYAELVQSSPNIPRIDEAEYYLALSYEQNGDFTNARKTYYDLIRTAPSSTYIPYAYFGFGEMFRRDGETDPSKNELADQAYREVMKSPQSPIAPFAKRRIDTLPRQ